MQDINSVQSTTNKSALVTGITGQDGAYLAQLLLNKGYQVYGTYRRSASVNFWRNQELGIDKHPNLHLVEYDLTDLSASIRLIEKIQPDEVYNLAAQSFVGVSFDQPVTTSEINSLGALHLLEAIRIVNPKIRFYQASTSEMFGRVQSIPQNEETPFYPRSPYAVAKLYAHWMAINYRESYDMFATSGILFNHESPLRGREFVTRKITDSLAKLLLGKLDLLELGNLDAQRDWGYAEEYVDAMWRMLQVDEPDTFVIATGRTTRIRDFVTMAFLAAGITLEFEGKDEQEIARVAEFNPDVIGQQLGLDAPAIKVGQKVMAVNPLYYRPAEVDLLIGDASKAKEILDWEATTQLSSLCEMMVKADLRRNLTGFSF